MAMAVGRLMAMVSGRTMQGAGSGPERELAPGALILQQDHGEVLTSSRSPLWSPLWRKKTPCMFDVSRFANASVVRCVRELSTSTISRRDETLEREEKTLHSCPNVFETEADAVRVECCGKGCRPVYEEEAPSSSFLTKACPVANFLREDFPSHAELLIKVQPQMEPELFGGWRFRSQSEAPTKSFECALQDGSYDSQHLPDFAIFAWRSLGDADKAEELYQEELDHAPCDNTDILASYANFLWQCDQ